jgi:predicted  nucleic acid-binding Zn-ribbon protein
VPDVSIKDQVKKIIELQKVDEQIYHLEIELKEKPAVLEQLKKEFETHKAGLIKLEEKLKAVQLARKEKELELKAKEEEIAKASAQLAQLKTNKEYAAKMSEIEHIKADKSITEEKILIYYDNGDAVNVEIEKEKVKVADYEKNYFLKKKETEDSVKVTEDRVKVLYAQRQRVTPGIDPAFLNRYERILRHKDGVAIVPVQGEGTCGGCFMNVTVQKINAIKMHDQFVECEMCSRILYLEDDL